MVLHSTIDHCKKSFPLIIVYQGGVFKAELVETVPLQVNFIVDSPLFYSNRRDQWEVPANTVVEIRAQPRYMRPDEIRVI